MENTFIYDRNGKIYDDADNPDHINFYGMLPFVECFREGRPEYAYLDTEPVNDIIRTESNNTIYEAFIKGYSKSTGADTKIRKSLKRGKS